MTSVHADRGSEKIPSRAHYLPHLSVMKILHITDLHFTLPWFDWVLQRQTEFDVVAISGDLADKAKIRRGHSLDEQWQAIREKLSQLTVPTFICGGNHDIDHPVLKEGETLAGLPALHLLEAVRGLPAVIVDGGSRVIGGYRFVCAPYRDVRSVAREILSSDEPVVLVTHVGPAGLQTSEQDGYDAGDEFVGEISFRMPKGSLILSGDVHHSRHWLASIGSATNYNPGNRFGNATPNHLVIDTSAAAVTCEINGRIARAALPAPMAVASAA
jgi:Icc-related predicted phosphoesterase